MSNDWTTADHAGMARRLGGGRIADETAVTARLAELAGVVYRLRDPDGCPWDREQTVASMAKNLVEEAYESVEAIAAADDDAICEELGDVLMNVVLIARIAEQGGRFGLADVAAGIAEKLVRRHPHVFGDASAGDADAALASWNESKRREGKGGGSLLDRVSDGLPGLARADELGRKAAGVGFDWPDATGARDKLVEEVGELDEALASGDRDHIEDELGDVLFSAVNVARKLDLDPELALRRATLKFRRRFAEVERTFGPRLGETPLEEMEQAWRRAASQETQP